MSRLQDPGPGEILDRLTILTLKVVHGRLAGADVSHFEQEAQALGQRPEIDVAYGKGTQLPIGVFLSLFAINAALWQAEDEIRRLRNAIPTEGWTGQVARCGLRIAKLNDDRASLVADINRSSGKPWQEKL